MNDTDVDARLTENARRWQEHRPAGPALANVLADMDVSDTGSTPLRRSGRNRRGIRPGRQLVALAAVAVVVAAVVLGVIVRSQRGDTAHPNGLPTAHPGDVSYHGITLTVPPSWPVAPAFCAPPKVDAVVPDAGETSLCPYIPPPKTAGTNTLVYLAPQTSTPDHLIRIARLRTTVDGVAALRGRGRDGRGTNVSRSVTVLIIPSVGVVVEIAAVNPSVADTILNTVRVTPVDRYGCRDHVLSYSPTGNRSADRLVPGRPVSGYICQYYPAESGEAGGWLVGSAALTRSRLDAAAALLNRFRPRGPFSAFTYASPHAEFVFRYPDGSTHSVFTGTTQSPILATDGHRFYSGVPADFMPSPFDR